ncbi:uncharacterized protein LOC7475940 isoform X4 [Populus trichocarpa]|uniref:uncharacterized protein LOC7475940 isoform X4 n=1 Tax=Populus trichocarpa TaxID=3694 RepID=UPI000D187AB6|nr:uncharacterized protein LOC7475940 isoform X4 [Populus trichocarpa]|eukprot:XP_024465060.1 uncharacterized protein LOC7475940 isoform X4 [Populus trichocarpa]
MLSKESGGSAFDLPEDVLQVLPSDPFQQLDVARKITSIALSTRVSALESESSLLRAKLAEKDDFIAHLQAQIESLDSSLSDSSDKLSRATQEKENLLKENASLSNTVKKLQRDVSKLEVFRKTLVQSLQEDEESSELHRSLPSLHQMMMPPCHLQDILQYKARFQKWETRLQRIVRQMLQDLAYHRFSWHPKQTHPGLLLQAPLLVFLLPCLPQGRLNQCLQNDNQCHSLSQEAWTIDPLPSLLCPQANIVLCQVTQDHKLDELELMAKNSSAKSGPACLTSSLVLFWQTLRN